jgi:hypothetical protein
VRAYDRTCHFAISVNVGDRIERRLLAYRLDAISRFPPGARRDAYLAAVQWRLGVLNLFTIKPAPQDAQVCGNEFKNGNTEIGPDVVDTARRFYHRAYN